MPRNRDFRQATSGELVAIQQVRGGTVGRYRPGIEPQSISEERSLGWINNIRFVFEPILWVAKRTVRIEIAVERVASLVVGLFACHKPGTPHGSVWRGIFRQLRRGTLRCSRTDPYFVDGCISRFESQHPDVWP